MMIISENVGGWSWLGHSARQWTAEWDRTTWRADVRDTLLVLAHDERLPGDLRLQALQSLNSGMEGGVLLADPHVQQHVLEVVMSITLGPSGGRRTWFRRRVLRRAEDRLAGARAAIRIGSMLVTALGAEQAQAHATAEKQVDITRMS